VAESRGGLHDTGEWPGPGQDTEAIRCTIRALAFTSAFVAMGAAR
jgi:hypothetical protein